MQLLDYSIRVSTYNILQLHVAWSFFFLPLSLSLSLSLFPSSSYLSLSFSFLLQQEKGTTWVQLYNKIKKLGGGPGYTEGRKNSWSKSTALLGWIRWCTYLGTGGPYTLVLFSLMNSSARAESVKRYSWKRHSQREREREREKGKGREEEKHFCNWLHLQMCVFGSLFVTRTGIHIKSNLLWKHPSVTKFALRSWHTSLLACYSLLLPLFLFHFHSLLFLFPSVHP